MGSSTNVPNITHILETVLYVRSLEDSIAFYNKLFGIKPFGQSNRAAFFGIGNTTLILFALGETYDDLVDENGTIPNHGPSKTIVDLVKPGREVLKMHYCFAVETREEVDAFHAKLQEEGVKILSTKNWMSGGGRSVYFEDPDGHVGEVASRGIWPHY